jgi:hypothetical protein
MLLESALASGKRRMSSASGIETAKIDLCSGTLLLLALLLTCICSQCVFCSEKLKILLHMEPNCPMEYKQNNGKITHSRSTSSQQHHVAAHPTPVSVPVAKPVGQAIEVAAQ